jgi:hypothetical protein
MNAEVALMAKLMMRTPSISACGFRSMISRSLNVPGSDSSAFTHRYAGRLSFGRNDALRPVGKPAPPRPRRPEASTWPTTSAGSIPSAFRREA